MHATRNDRRSAFPLLVSSLVLALALPCAARERRVSGDPPPPLPWFDGELDAARHEAKERNVPILVFAVQEAEDESDRFHTALFAHKGLPKVVDRAVLLVVNDGDHPARVVKEEQPDGSVIERSTCSRYGTADCDAHRRNWDRVYLELGAVGSVDGGWKLPEGFVLKPDGTLHERHHDGNPPSMDAILASFEAAAKEAGPGLSNPELAEVKAALERGALAVAGKQWQTAWREYASVLAITTTTSWGLRAQAESEVVASALRAELEALRPRLVPAEIESSYRALWKLAKETAGTPLEKDVEKELERVGRDKEMKETVARVKLDLESEDLWAEHEELERAGDEKKARAILKKLLTPRFAETTGGKRAREKSGG